MATDYDSDADSFVSSSSSDDEFLTIKGGQSAGVQDREAMIRKKLLESFYGAAAVQQQEPEPVTPTEQEAVGDTVEAMESDDSNEDDDDEEDTPDHGASKDLDSPYFDADAHTSEHVVNSSVHTLLETEERLALQVRTLDSTMQTLVYENYSKFIDATDAIRSIGVSVNANEAGLARLGRGMQTIDDQSRSVEDALGSLRDAVAEKLRVKRLLSRLDALLKLPTTLQHQIATGKYRLATKSYLSAYSILSKHSTGFESLKSIETECHDILTDMVDALKRKLLNWSGRKSDVHDLDDETQAEGDWVPPPEPPKTMSEIFECAGTILLVLPRGDDDSQRITFESGLSADECKSMALAAAVRLLDRVLDSHQIELQEAMFSTIGFEDNTLESKRAGIAGVHESEIHTVPKGSNLIPTAFLDNVLEAATLFGLSFGSGCIPNLNGSDRLFLIDFVSEVFASFLSHVRSVLLDQSAQNEPLNDQDVDDDDDDGDAAYSEISGAMSHLLRSVRDLASGLALPEVGIDMEFASSLVDQTVEVTEAMVRRRVGQKFHRLRLRVVQGCLGPFIREALAHPTDSDVRVVQIVQIASVALSDGLQFVDDTIRNILTGGVVISSIKGVDFEMVKDAVRTSSFRFARWLAYSLEILAGCESSDSRFTIEGQDMPAENVDEGSMRVAATSIEDDMSDVSDQGDYTIDKVEVSLQALLAEIEEVTSAIVYSDFTLAISEMCRLAERSVMENINQSIMTTVNGGRKSHKSSSMFPSSPTSMKGPANQDKAVSDRFRLAASRVLSLYAINRGSDAAMLACAGFDGMAQNAASEIPNCPRSEMCQLLEVAKLTSIDCANVFGGEKRAGPVPEFPEEVMDSILSALTLGRASSNTLGAHLGGMKGLQLDVERMFTEKVAIYPPLTSLLDFTRNTVATLVLKVAFKAMSEQARVHVFTTNGYQQLQIDLAFLHHMLPHYVKDDFVLEGISAQSVLQNLLNDILTNAGERCLNEDCVGKGVLIDKRTGVQTNPLAIVRIFMTPGEFSDDEDRDHLFSRFLIEEP